MLQTINIKKLNGKNYQLWKYKLKLIVGFWRITQEGLEAYPGMQQLLVKEMIFHKWCDKVYWLITLNVEKGLQKFSLPRWPTHLSMENFPEVFWVYTVTQIVIWSISFIQLAWQKVQIWCFDALSHMTLLTEQSQELNEEISSRKFAAVVLGSLPKLFNNNLLTSWKVTNADDPN